MRTLKLISIYIGLILVIFSLVFCTSGLLRSGWIIYVNQPYNNLEKLKYKIENDDIIYIQQDNINKVLEKYNIEIPKNSIIQKIQCTTALSNGYNVKVFYINNNREYEYSKIDEYSISNYVISNGYKYKDNTFAKLKICIVIIILYIIIEIILIAIYKKIRK